MASVTKIFLPFTLGQDDGYSPVGASTEILAADPGDPLNHDDDGSYNAIGSGSVNADLGFKPDTSFVEKMAFIQSVIVFWRAERTSSNVNTALHTITEPDTTVNVGSAKTLLLNTYATESHDFTAIRNWVEADFRDADFEFGFRGSAAGPAMRITSQWCEVENIPLEVFVQFFREAVGRELRETRFAPRNYSKKTRLDRLKFELMDDIGLADADLPRVSELVENLDRDGLIGEEERLYSAIVGQRIDLNTMTMDSIIRDMERSICLFWSTFKVPAAVDDDQRGLVETDNGALKSFSRTTKGYLKQADDFIADVSEGLEKINHRGILCEPANTNLVENSNLQDGTATDWALAQDGSGGAWADETSIMLFTNETSFPNTGRLTRGTLATWAQQGSLSVAAADVHRTLVMHTMGMREWALQRSTDSRWWNDSAETWDVSKVWNALTNSGGWDVDVSNPLDIDFTGTLTLQIGMNTGSQNDLGYLGQADLVEDSFILSPIVTDSTGTVTTVADQYSRVIDDSPFDDRQTAYAKRGTVRFLLDCENPGTRFFDGDETVWAYWVYGFGTTDYDAILYEKTVAENVRIVYRRVRSSSVDTELFDEISLVRGTIYEIAVTWDDNDLMRLYRDKVLRAQAVAGGSHSPTETHTETWVGTASPTLTITPAMQYISDFEVLQRALPQSEIGARI